MNQEIIDLTALMYEVNANIITTLGKLHKETKNQLANATIQIQGLRNGMVTNITEFQHKLNSEATASVNTNIKNAEANLKTNMETYILEHTTTL